MTRTDIHRPSAIVPADYDYVGIRSTVVRSLDDLAFIRQERERIQRHMAATGATYSTHEHGGVCGVCGNVLAQTTCLFWHRPTNRYILAGTDCARKIDEAAAGEATLFSRKLRDVMDRKAGKEKAIAVLERAGLADAWKVYADTDRERRTRDEAVVVDIVGKLVAYGNLSDKQQAFLAQLLQRIADRPRIEAQRAAENEAAAPCPVGRVEFQGELLTRRVDDFGVLKGLVRADAGWKVWLTLPAAGSGSYQPHSRLHLRATVTPSNNDPKFGFGKRPVLCSDPLPPAPVPAGS